MKLHSLRAGFDQLRLGTFEPFISLRFLTEDSQFHVSRSKFALLEL